MAAGGLRLALAAVPVPDESYWPSPGVRAWRAFLDVMRQVPWEEGAVIGIAWLEVLHPSRPWHTAVLGAGLIAYLLVVHLAESDARLATLRPQARVLGLGAVVLALGAGAGMLPAAGPGAGSALLRLVAAGALIAAARPRPPLRRAGCITGGKALPKGGQDPMAEIVRAALVQQRWTGDKESMIAAAVQPHPDRRLGRARRSCACRNCSTGRTSARCRTPTTTPTPRRSRTGRPPS